MITARKRRLVPRGLALRATGIAAFVAAALLFAPPPAGAATYTVETCTNGSISGWSSFYDGVWTVLDNSCGVPGGGLVARSSTVPNATAGWRFIAPVNTEIAGFRLTRSYSLPANTPFGTGVVTTKTDGSGNGFYTWEPNFGGAVSVGPQTQVAGNLTGQTALTARLDCGGGAGCTGPSNLVVYSASIDLRDGLAPALGTVSGALFAHGPLKGTRAVSLTATDRGGGIRREQLLVDGQPAGDRWLDCNFALVVPCPLTDSGTFTLDTTRLAEGEHDLQLLVADATLGNITRYGPIGIAVDNVSPPGVSVAPSVHGTAVRGQLLYADDGSWTGANLSFARRWQRYEDGSWQNIAGATDAAYTVGAEDAGHRLRFHVRAANSEGATDAYSEATALVPRLETPAPSAAPTAAPQRPAAAGVPAARGARVAAAFQATGRTTITLRYGRRPKVAGTLVRADGTPIAGAQLVVSSQLRMLDAQPRRVAHVTTDSAGQFAYSPGTGPSRVLTFAYGDVRANVTIRVMPRIALRLRANGRLEGRVTGAPAGLRPTVDLQAAHGPVWRTYATTRLRPTGGTFACHAGRPRDRVRALIRADPSWPFASGTSAAVGDRR